jgi:hypothetical protein
MYHVVDVGEIAALFAVTIDGRLLSSQHPSAEDRQYAGVVRCRILAGTEDVEVAEDYSFQAVDSREYTHVVFTGQLGHRIGRDGVRRHRLMLRQRGRVAVRRRGSSVDYLPPYSPDLNPTEKAWAKFKQFLRSAKARTAEALDQAITEALKNITPDNAAACFRSCGYRDTGTVALL